MLRAALALSAVLTVCPSAGAMAQATPKPAAKISIELNAVEQAEKACRVTFVVVNGLASEIGELALETVVFDGAGAVQRLVVMKTGRLPAGKTRVRQFDLADIACDRIARILVNDVTECQAAGMAPPACLDAIAASSKARIALEL